MFSQIFKCERLQESNGNFSLVQKKQNQRTQIVIMDDINVDYYFSKGKYAKVKRFFEGNGIVTEEKFRDPVLSYSSLPIIVTSNSLPDLGGVDWKALEVRIVLVKTNLNSFKEVYEFPFNVY